MNERPLEHRGRLREVVIPFLFIALFGVAIALAGTLISASGVSVSSDEETRKHLELRDRMLAQCMENNKLEYECRVFLNDWRIR